MRGANEKGLAVVLVLVLVVALFAAFATFVRGTHETAVLTSVEDRFKALTYAESGLALAKARVYAAGACGLGALLKGPDLDGSGDDALIGLRDLSLASTAGFTRANEQSGSAIVLEDFGDGRKKYEALRMSDGPTTRGIVYVRIDRALAREQDGLVVATSVAEYPVHVDEDGVELARAVAERPRARRSFRATFRLEHCDDLPPGRDPGGRTVTWWEMPQGLDGGISSP